MPSHPDRVRRNYACPHCDGTGKVDDYEGWYECWDCDGSGIILVEKGPRYSQPANRLPLKVEDWVIQEGLDNLVNQFNNRDFFTKQLP